MEADSVPAALAMLTRSVLAVCLAQLVGIVVVTSQLCSLVRDVGHAVELQYFYVSRYVQPKDVTPGKSAFTEEDDITVTQDEVHFLDNKQTKGPYFVLACAELQP